MQADDCGRESELDSSGRLVKNLVSKGRPRPRGGEPEPFAYLYGDLLPSPPARG